MKKFGILCLILLLAIATAFCISACNPSSEGGTEEPSGTKISYEITVDTSKVTVDVSGISVCIYSLDGTSVGEKNLSKGKTVFELEADGYVATLSGLSEEFSYSSVLLTKNTKKATIVLEDTEYNEYSQNYEFAFTVIVMAKDINLNDLFVQICDDSSCIPVDFENGNVADLFLTEGEYEVKVSKYTGTGADELYHENYTVTLNRRFCVIRLSGQSEHAHAYGDWDEVPATCENAGKRTRKCDGCGDIQTEIINAPGHAWSDFEVTTPAKCTVAGEQTRTCSNCGDIQTEVIDAPGHAWLDFKVTTPAKCGVHGEQTRICDVCNNEETVDIPALEHIWSDYIETMPATCKSAGVKTRSCTLCHNDESIEISQLEHKWSDYVETSPAACEKKGEKTRLCELCKTEEKEEIPALKHEWSEEKIIKNPTCEDTGIRSVTCDLCGTSLSEDIIPATGHVKKSGFPLIGATCEGEGLSQNTCAVCGETYREKDPPIGHEYSEEFTTDITPTASTEGEESRHCTRRGCDSRTDIRALPRLVSESYFRIYIVRGEKNKPASLPLVSMRNESGQVVASGYCFADDDGRYMFERRLSLRTYTVTLSGITNGFVHGEYTISDQDGQYPYDSPETYPSITIHLYSYLGEGAMEAGNKRHTVLNDFSFTTVYGEQVRLSDLLKTKKIVWLNFYYNSCSPCQAEAPTIVRVAERHKDDVAVVCFNGKDDPESIKSGAASIFKYPNTFYLVDDRSAVYGKMFGRSGYPLNVFIDSGGYVFESVSGSNYASQFESFISNNIFETPERETKSVAETLAEIVAILPDKQRYVCDVEEA